MNPPHPPPLPLPSQLELSRSSQPPNLPLPHPQNARIRQPFHLPAIQLRILPRRKHPSVVPDAVVLHQIRVLPALAPRSLISTLALRGRRGGDGEGQGRFHGPHELDPRAGGVAERGFEARHVGVVGRGVRAGVLEEVEEAYGLLGGGGGEEGGEEGGHLAVEVESSGSWTLGVCRFWCFWGDGAWRDGEGVGLGVVPGCGERRGCWEGGWG